MSRPTKTHYVTLRIVFDKPCDERAAVRAAEYGLKRLNDYVATQLYGVRDMSKPASFKVARVISMASTKGLRA